MAYSSIAIVAPHVTAYDEDYPTRSTENYSHELHEILQDMEDAGPWYLNDGVINSTQRTTFMEWIHDAIEVVFDYAEGAIDSYRSSGSPTLSKPLFNDIADPPLFAYREFNLLCWKTYQECIKTMYFIYYMWKTEEDPLLLQEKLRELLIAWPLLDTTIELNSDLGQSFKVYPSWKNADLGT